jgi:hypothetical protein
MRRRGKTDLNVRFSSEYLLFVRLLEYRTEKDDPRGPAVPARVVLINFVIPLLSPCQQAVDRGVHIQVLGFPAPRHHDIGAPEESDKDTARHFKQGVAVG